MAYLVVIGAVNMDIGGVSDGTLILQDSNPGRVRTSLGGVGRNIAHNLCLLGCEVKMITALGEDDFARRIRENAEEIGLDLTYSAVIPGAATSSYLFIAGPDGDMQLAVNDMAIYEHMTPAFLAARQEVINGAALVVLDANLPGESIAWLGEHCTAPLLADPVSTVKAGKLRPILAKLLALKPNRLEAELFTGKKIATINDARDAALALRALGVGQVYLSLGAEGICAVGADGRAYHLACPPFTPVNATGGGDAMVAAIGACLVEGLGAAETARRAVTAGVIACEAAETINPAMSREAVETRKNMIQQEELV